MSTSASAASHPIYEHDFYEGSYGFRPKRSAHQALQKVWDATMEVYGGWGLEVDIRKFYDNLGHKHLQNLIQLRVRDGGNVTFHPLASFQNGPLHVVPLISTIAQWK